MEVCANQVFRIDAPLPVLLGDCLVCVGGRSVAILDLKNLFAPSKHRQITLAGPVPHVHTCLYTPVVSSVWRIYRRGVKEVGALYTPDPYLPPISRASPQFQGSMSFTVIQSRTLAYHFPLSPPKQGGAQTGSASGIGMSAVPRPAQHHEHQARCAVCQGLQTSPALRAPAAQQGPAQPS